MSSSLADLYLCVRTLHSAVVQHPCCGWACVFWVWKASDVPVAVATKQQRAVLSNKGLSGPCDLATNSVARKATLGRRCVTEALHRRGSNHPPLRVAAN